MRQAALLKRLGIAPGQVEPAVLDLARGNPVKILFSQGYTLQTVPTTVGGALPEYAMERVDIATDQIGFPEAMKGDRLRPLRSAQAVAVHQDGIGGRGHPVERCRFLPDHAKYGAVRRRHGLRPRRSGPRRFDAGRRAVRKLRGRTYPSRAFGGIKGATTRLTAPAYWKFESRPLQRRVSDEPAASA